MKRTGFALFVTLVMVGLNGSADASIIYNGSFEIPATGASLPTSFTQLNNGSTAIDGWTVGGNSIDWIGTYWTAAAGSYSIDLAGGRHGTIFATNAISTVIGQTYLLRFAMAGNPAGGSTTKTMVVSVNDLVSQTYTFSTVGKSRTNMGWVYHDLVFTADSSSTTIEFANSGDSNAYGAALDDVSLTAIPEPTTFLIWSLLGGLALTIWRRR